MTQVVILAAGHGTRMKSKLPKVLQEVKGVPIIQRLVGSVINSGVSQKPVVVVSHDGGAIKDYLGDLCDYAVQEEQLGTGHAVACARENLSDADNVLVLYGDHPFLKPETIKKLSELHISSPSPLTMMTIKLDDFNDWKKVFYDFGRILRNEAGQIIGIREKKDANEAELQIKEVNPALFCFNGAWLWDNILKINRNNNQGEYYLTDLVALAMSDGHSIDSLEVDPRESLGLNTPEHLQIAEELF
ncbi:MAG: NTP transferase domain-containing protein [Patescibacteria group bacterium]|nr:NTP transferase domain-containing protein [Patescibacteria group bacterium]MDD5490952.1 NTP transferase domain-containing protein [Patescibacteria group bacterium]